MARKGRELEKVVAALEKLLSGTDVEIVSPDYIVDVTGSRREVDVSLRTKIGSSDILVIVECRDRKGTQGIAWIEQLAKKRDRVLAAKAVAVSASGFSDDAIEAARNEGIELRTIENLTSGEIASWFQVEHLMVRARRSDVIRMRLVTEDEKGLNLLRKVLPQGPLADALILVEPETGQATSFLKVFKRVMNQNPHVFDGIECNNEPEVRSLWVDFPEPDSRYQIVTNEGEATIAQICFITKLWIECSMMPISPKILQYSTTEGVPIAQSVKFEAKSGERLLELDIHNVEGKGITIVGRLHSPDPEEELELAVKCDSLDDE